MALSGVPAPPPETACEAVLAAEEPPPFSGPATPSATNMLSSRMICGSAESSSCAPRILNTETQAEMVFYSSVYAVRRVRLSIPFRVCVLLDSHGFVDVNFSNLNNDRVQYQYYHAVLYQGTQCYSFVNSYICPTNTTGMILGREHYHDCNHNRQVRVHC